MSILKIYVRNMEDMWLQMYDAILQSTTDDYIIHDSVQNRPFTEVLGKNEISGEYTSVKNSRTGPKLNITNYYIRNQKGTKYFVTDKTDQTYTAYRVVLPQGHMEYFYETDGYDQINPHRFVITGEGTVKCQSCDAVATVNVTVPDVTYNGKAQTPAATVMLKFADGKENVAAAYTTAKGIKSGYILGGPALISDKAAKTIFGMSAEDKIIEK